jgi:hypothetical protein
MAHLSHWILTGDQPQVEEILLPETNLRSIDVIRKKQHEPAYPVRLSTSSAKACSAGATCTS